MSFWDTIDKMRSRPWDVQPEEFETVAKRLGLPWREGKHRVYSHPHRKGVHVPIPRHAPVKRTYVEQFLEMIDDLLP